MIYFPTPEVLVPQTDYIDRDSSATAELVDTFRRRSMGAMVVAEVTTTMQSLRGNHPTTVLGALISRDGQSISELEARLVGSQPSEGIFSTLDTLQVVGLVESYDDRGIQRYSLVEPEE